MAMCSECQIAGSFNVNGVWFKDHDREAEAEREFAHARRLHATCLWPESCTCRHVVGVTLRRAEAR